VKEAFDTFAKNQGESSRHLEKETKDASSFSQYGHNRDHWEDVHFFRPMKMEFPRFCGEDPIIWLDQVTQSFEYQATVEQKVTLAAFYLEGEAN
jgi:hypothetical protein